MWVKQKVSQALVSVTVKKCIWYWYIFFTDKCLWKVCKVHDFNRVVAHAYVSFKYILVKIAKKSDLLFVWGWIDWKSHLLVSLSLCYYFTDYLPFHVVRFFPPKINLRSPRSEYRLEIVCWRTGLSLLTTKDVSGTTCTNQPM